MSKSRPWRPSCSPRSVSSALAELAGQELARAVRSPVDVARSATGGRCRQARAAPAGRRRSPRVRPPPAAAGAARDVPHHETRAPRARRCRRGAGRRRTASGSRRCRGSPAGSGCDGRRARQVPRGRSSGGAPSGSPSKAGGRMSTGTSGGVLDHGAQRLGRRLERAAGSARPGGRRPPGSGDCTGVESSSQRDRELEAEVGARVEHDAALADLVERERPGRDRGHEDLLDHPERTRRGRTSSTRAAGAHEADVRDVVLARVRQAREGQDQRVGRGMRRRRCAAA